MRFIKENSILITALLTSLLVHAGIFILFSKIEKIKTTKKEEKPIIISFVNTKESTETSSAKRKIPRKTKLNTPKKSTKPSSSKTSTHKNKPTIKKSKTKKKASKKSVKKRAKKSLKKSKTTKITQKPVVKDSKTRKKQPKLKPKETNTPKPEKKEEEKKVKIPQKNENQPKNDIQIKEEGKKLQIASGKPEKEVKNVPKIPTPPAENNKAKEEKPPQQLNLSHLKGKDEIYQIGSENKKENKSPKKDEDIMKYLYGVRDKLQENLAYPLMAKRLEIEGTVIVRFVINPDGSVDEKTIKVVKSSGSNILDKQAVITVKNSIPFEPTPNKKKVVVEIPVIFEIIRSYD